MRDARTGTTRHKPRPAPALTHRQQQIVHNARALVQAPRGSKQHQDAARNLAALNLNDHEHNLAARAAQQHHEHLDRMAQAQRRSRGASLEPISSPRGHDVTSLMAFALPGLSHELHYHEAPRASVGHNADEGDIMLRQAGINDALKKTQISPVLRGLRTATQDIIGPSITAYAHGEHASRRGLAIDAAMLVDPTKVARGAHAAVEAARAGEGAVEAIRAARAATRGASVENRAVVNWKRTKAGKQAVADVKAHPIRNAAHAEIDAYPDMTPREKQAMKRHVDDTIHQTAMRSGKSVDEILAQPNVVRHAAELRMTPEEVVANRIRPRNPGHEGLAPVGEADPALRASVAHALSSHGVDTSVFRKADIDPHKFADLIARGEPGRFWYEQSGKRILDEAHGNKEIADKIAQLFAVYSAQRAPVENVQLALNAFHEWQRTGAVRSFGTGPQIAKANQILVEGVPWEGLKTDRFYGNLLEEIDPEKYAAMFPGGEVTNDIWMARLFGLKTDNPTTREYHAMTGIVQRIADELGWKPKQVQAALWVAKKAEHEGTSIDQAAIDFSTALHTETAHLPFEAAPGAEYAPALHEQYLKLPPPARRAYTAAKADLVNQFLDEAGIFGRLGHEGVGVYETQINPGWTVYVPASRGKGPEFDIAVAPHAREELDSVAAAIGQAFHQDAAAWFKPFYKKSVSATDRNGVKAILGRGMSEEEAIALDERFRAAGQDVAIIHDADGVHFMNLDPEALPNRAFHDSVGATIDAVFGPETRSLTYAADGNYITKEAYSAHLAGDAGGRSDVLRAAADRLEERGAEIDAQFLAERGAGGDGTRFRAGGDGLSSGFNPGFDDNTERGLIGDWFAKIRGKDTPAPAEAAPTAEELASKEVMKGLKGAGATRREQEAGYSRVRGERINAAMQEMGKVTGLEEKLAAAKSQLAGELPKLQHNGLRGLSKDTVDGPLVDIVENHPGLEDFEKVRVLTALRNAWIDGTVPTDSELGLLRRTFGTKTTREMMAPKHLSKYEKVLDVANIPRALMSSFDVSAPFRQGLVALVAHPLLTSRNMGPMMKYLGSEQGYQAMMRDIASRPNADLYHEADLAITDVEHSLANREDYFNSTAAEWFPKALGGSKRSPVRMSGRAYTGFLVKTRADLFDHYIEYASSIGHDVSEMGKAERKKFLTDLGHYVNGTTGRGSLGKWESSAQNLATVFFSPRLMASRLEYLWLPSYFKLHPFVRRQKMKTALKFATTMGLFLYGASKVAGVKVGTDPWSADFGKIRVGDTRFDITGGFAGYIRMLGVLSQAATHTEGETHKHKAWETTLRFLRGKASPLTAYGIGTATGTDYTGYQTFHPGSEAGKLLIPFIAQDVYKVVQNKDSLPKVLETAGASAIGVGVNTYKDNPATKKSKKPTALEKFNKNYAKKVGGPLPPDVRAAEETKTMYDHATDRRKKELGVSSLTDEQRTYVKLAVIESQHPELRQSVDALRQSLDAPGSGPVAKEIDSWAEDTLGWSLLDQYKDALK